MYVLCLQCTHHFLSHSRKRILLKCNSTIRFSLMNTEVGMDINDKATIDDDKYKWSCVKYGCNVTMALQVVSCEQWNCGKDFCPFLKSLLSETVEDYHKLCG